MARENFSNLLFITEQSSLDKGFWERKNPAVDGMRGGSPPHLPQNDPTAFNQNFPQPQFG
jgi:hypothetical protein